MFFSAINLHMSLKLSGVPVLCPARRTHTHSLGPSPNATSSVKPDPAPMCWVVTPSRVPLQRIQELSSLPFWAWAGYALLSALIQIMFTLINFHPESISWSKCHLGNLLLLVNFLYNVIKYIFPFIAILQFYFTGLIFIWVNTIFALILQLRYGSSISIFLIHITFYIYGLHHSFPLWLWFQPSFIFLKQILQI